MAVDPVLDRYDAPGEDHQTPWFTEQRRVPMGDGAIGTVARLLIGRGIGVRLYTRDEKIALGVIKDVEEGVITVEDEFTEQRTPIADVVMLAVTN